MPNTDLIGAIGASLLRLTHRQRHFVCERLTELLYVKTLDPGDCALDCGANIGHHTRRLSRVLGESGLVHAFEPNPDLFRALAAIGSNVRIWPFAVGDVCRLATLHVPEGQIGWASLQDIRCLLPQRSFKMFTTVQIRIDEIPEMSERPVRFIKIDVERNELLALKGMRQLLVRDRPLIVLEGLDADIGRFLYEIGYQVRHLTGCDEDPRFAGFANSVAVHCGRVEEFQGRAAISTQEVAEICDEAFGIGAA